jgi:hypothetical protein
MVKASLDKIERIVKEFIGRVPTDKIQSVIVELGTIRGYLNCLADNKDKRIQFPKKFSIETKRDFIKLQEVTPSTTTYCSDFQYDMIVKAVIALQSRRENFNRWTLQTEAQKVDPRVTVPAVLACMHYWISMPDALLSKSGLMFKISCEVDDFENLSNIAWDDLVEDKLHIEAPK